jgi:hypothetical protein
MEWKYLSSPLRKRFKVQESAEKIVLTLFHDMEGPVFYHYIELGMLITSTFYWHILENDTKTATL